jgi:DNA polymerase-3 subunit epsilon
MLKFTAFDFETANKYANSACSLAAVSVEGNRTIHEGYALIRPPFLTFDEENVRIHGITPQMVREKPDFASLWPSIKKRLDGAVLIAHYAVFDTRVLRSLIKTYRLQAPHATYTCSVEISRKVWPELKNHKLDTVAAYLDYPFHHHQVLDDARACAFIVQAAAAKVGAESVEELLDRLNLSLKNL